MTEQEKDELLKSTIENLKRIIDIAFKSGQIEAIKELRNSTIQDNK